MKRIAIAGTILGALLLAGCASEPAAPTPREQACESIKGLTPGWVESHWAIETLSNSASTPAQRLEALKQQTAPKPTSPYTCEGQTFERYLAEQTAS